MKLFTLFALASTLAISPVVAQTDHYEGIKWKNRHTSHFVLRANGTDHEPGKKHAEDVYDLTVAILPGLKADFEEKKFRTPGGDDGGDGEQFHYTIYMTGDASTYLTMVQQEAGKGRRGGRAEGYNMWLEQIEIQMVFF